jgi:hypothetical protein
MSDTLKENQIATITTKGIEGIDTQTSMLSKAAFYKFYWVAVAASTDTTRPIINSIYVEGSSITATDGRRLHHDAVGNVYGLDDGIWFVVKLTKTKIVIERKLGYLGLYPDYTRIIPSIPAECKEKGESDDWLRYKFDNSHKGMAGIVCLLTGVPLNTNYISDILNSNPSDHNIRVTAYAQKDKENDGAIARVNMSNTPIQINLSGTRFAVVAPMSVSKFNPTR